MTRIPVKAINRLPFYLESNIQPFGLKLRKQSVYFLPDKILVISKMNVGAISYADIVKRFGLCNFRESDPVPSDSKIIGETWLKVNKNGSPDKRFKDNRLVPICEYGTVQINSAVGLQIELMCSNSRTIVELSNLFANFDNAMN